MTPNINTTKGGKKKRVAKLQTPGVTSLEKQTQPKSESTARKRIRHPHLKKKTNALTLGPANWRVEREKKQVRVQRKKAVQTNPIGLPGDREGGVREEGRRGGSARGGGGQAKLFDGLFQL